MADAEIAQFKACTKCSESKPLEDFSRDATRTDGRFPWCRTCKSSAAKAAYAQNPEPTKERAARHRQQRPEMMRQWREANGDRIKAYSARWYAENREAERERYARFMAENPDYKREYRRRKIDRYREIAKRRRSTPRGKIDGAMSRGINRSLKGMKSGRSWEALVGYTVADLMAHLEKLFLPGMTFENHGDWHIDHVTPLSAFNYQAAEHFDFRRAWALSNLQPLWAEDNLKKHAKVDGPFQPSLAI